MATLPPGAVPPGATQAFLEMVRRNEAHQPPASLRGLAACRGVALSTVVHDVEVLRRHGLVAWQRGSARTLHPTFRVVAHGTPTASQRTGQ